MCFIDHDDDLFSTSVRKKLVGTSGYAKRVKQPKRAKSVDPVFDSTEHRLLFIDIGLHMGWSTSGPGPANISSGVWELGAGGKEGKIPGARISRLQHYLEEFHAKHPVGWLCFELVRRHEGTQAAHVYGGLMHKILEFCYLHKIPYTTLEVSAIKKAATGRGNADKEAVIMAAKDRWPVMFPGRVDECDDNQADACWGLVAAYKQLTQSPFLL